MIDDVPKADPPAATANPQPTIFETIRFEATPANFWNQTETELPPKPVQSVRIEVGYPDAANPLRDDGHPNVIFRATGVHYVLGEQDPDRHAELAIWTKDNPHDIVGFTFNKLAEPLLGWDLDEFRVRESIVFDPNDPRVDLVSGGSIYTRERTTCENPYVVNGEGLGSVFVKFRLASIIPNDAVSILLTCSLGKRTDTFHVTRANQKDIEWTIFSDKYRDETSFTYNLQVTVVGSALTDEPVEWGTQGPVRVNFPDGSIKFLDDVKLILPPAPSDQVARVNEYIASFHA